MWIKRKNQSSFNPESTLESPVEIQKYSNDPAPDSDIN